MKYNFDESTIVEGVIAWLCFNLGFIPLLIFIYYLKKEKGRTYNKWTGYLRKKSLITFVILILIEVIIFVSFFVFMLNKIKNK